MEYDLDTPISAFAIHPTQTGRIFLGFLDGTLCCRNFDFNQPKQQPKNGKQNTKKSSNKGKSGEELWRSKLKKAIRSAQFSPDGTSIYVTSSNKALCMFDAETGKRVRCIRECHKSRPNALCLLPTKINRQQFATGAENGEIKTWDFRQPKPQCARFGDQEDVINSFYVWKNGTLLAASSDGTLAAYDLHKAKVRVQSEAMHSELLSLAVTNHFTYAGSADGHIEVFKNGEFGNILERIETPMLMGVEQLAVLRNNLLLATASTQDEIRFVHVNPNKCLGGIPFPGGVDLACKTPNSTHFLVTSGDGTKMAAFPLAEIVRDVPDLKAQDMAQFKRMEKERRRKEGGDGQKEKREFYKDMLDEDEEEEDSEMDEEEEDGIQMMDLSDSDEEEEDEEDEEEVYGKLPF